MCILYATDAHGYQSVCPENAPEGASTVCRAKLMVQADALEVGEIPKGEEKSQNGEGKRRKKKATELL